MSFYSGQFSKTVLPLTFTSFCSLRISSFTCLNTPLSSAGGAAGGGLSSAGGASGEGIVGYPDAVAGNPASAWGGDSKE